MKIIIITFIIIAVVILGGLWYLNWLRKCYDKHQAEDSAPKLAFEQIAKSYQNCKIYDERRAAVKRYMLLITFCTLILGGGAYFVDAKYEQWSADFKQWKVERAERKAQAELQKQKEERLEAERKAQEARKQDKIAKQKSEQFQKLQNQNIVQKKAEQRKKNIFIAKVNFCLLFFAIFLFFSFFLCILYCAGSKK